MKKDISHYFSAKNVKKGKKVLIPLYIHGLSLEFLSYTSLFSGTSIDKGTLLLLENIIVPDKGVVLDIGCGYGVIGITVAKMNPRLKVYMIDINPLAVKTARYNARLNNVEDQVEVIQGNLYEPVKNMVFKAIYSNPPLSAGKDVVKQITIKAREHLEPSGFIQVVLSRGHEYYMDIVKKHYAKTITIKKKGYLIITAYMK